MIHAMEDDKKLSKPITVTYLNGKIFDMPPIDHKNV